MEIKNSLKEISGKNVQKVYLDNGATTRIDENAFKKMVPYYEINYGNPSSLHSFGADANDAVTNSRKIIANTINANESEIIFTSGGTEANNLALKGIAFYKKKGHIITTKIEHDCILNACKWLESQGFSATYLDVDTNGFINLKKLKDSIRPDTFLVSIIHGNNEIGTIQDLGKIGKICREHNILFHSDACQSYTKVPIDVKSMNIDLLTINSHKIHGPKGVGALYIKDGIDITSLFHGGGHEFKHRAGTENVPGVVGFAAAAEIGISDLEKNAIQMKELRDYLLEELLKIPNTILNGPNDDRRLCNNANVTFLYVEGEAMLMHLDLLGVCVSTGSACSSKSLRPSHVLTALGRSAEEAHGSLRFTLSKYTTKSEIDYAIEKTKQVVENLRMISPLTPKVN